MSPDSSCKKMLPSAVADKDPVTPSSMSSIFPETPMVPPAIKVTLVATLILVRSFPIPSKIEPVFARSTSSPCSE